MRRLAFSIIGVIAVAAIVIGINMFADARFVDVRADLTQDKIYTLSKGTRQILNGLKEPVTLRFFYSRRLGATVPAYGTYADHVREMLEEYASASHGKVKVEYYDPEPFSDTEDHAVAYGLQGVPVDNAGNNVYFGLAGNNLEDDERTIPFFQAEREGFLEYDLTKMVYDLSNPKRTTIGVMSSLPIDGDPRAMMMGGGTGAKRTTLRGFGIVAANQHGEAGGARRPGDRSRHPGLAGGRGAASVRCHALCHRPVRHAWRQADGHGRSVERGACCDALPHRHAAHRYFVGPEEIIRRLGHRLRPYQGDWRPDGCMAGPRRAARTACRRSITWPGSISAMASITTIPRRPI